MGKSIEDDESRVVITLRSGQQVGADVTSFSMQPAPISGQLREVKWEQRKGADPVLGYVDLSEIAAVHFEQIHCETPAVRTGTLIVKLDGSGHIINVKADETRGSVTVHSSDAGPGWEMSPREAHILATALQRKADEASL
jgi:hypothetical protein